MSSIVYLRNPKSNTIYAYLNESIWDPDKKKCITKRKCIGHVDPDTGEIVPNRKAKSRECPVVKCRYLTKVLDKVSEDIRLSETLALSFPDDWKKIISLAYYLLVTEGELSFAKQWSEQNNTPYNQIMDKAMINELLSGLSHNNISLFFTLWKLRVQPEESYVSSINFLQSESTMDVYGRTKDFDFNDISSRMKMDIYFESRTNMPICYQLYNMASGREMGDYDVSAASFSRLSAFIDEEAGDVVDPSLIAYAKSNLIVRMKPDNDFVSDLIKKAAPSMTNPENYRTLFGVPMFFETFMQHVNGKKFYIHVFFDPDKAVGDLSTFISIINLCKYELEMEKPVEAHQYLYDKYLIVKEENGKTVVEHNSEAILHHNEFLGYSVIASNFTRNPSMAMVPFLQRRAITQMFENTYNDYDKADFNLFTDINYLSRIFIEFVALILRMSTESIMNSRKLNKSMTFKQMVNELSSIKTVKVPGLKKQLQTDLSDTQVRILETFDIDYEMD